MIAAAVASVQVLADGNSPADVDPTTGHGPEWGKAAPIGLLIVVLLCVAVYFLVKSMNRNLRKVPESFDPAAKVAVGAAAATGTADAVHGEPGPTDGTATDSSATGKAATRNITTSSIATSAVDAPPAAPPPAAPPAAGSAAAGRPAE